MAEHFIIPKKYYQMTFIILLILTVITVAISRVDLGILNTAVAVLVASIKATFVGAFFMGLRWEKANLIFVFGGIAAIVLFFLFIFVDLGYRGAIDNMVELPHHYESPVTITPMDGNKGH
ncbi:MAG: cytochrome C oxidase subunit IV family protein [Candidatus Marinamargulisbacteria bacterium]